MGEENLYRPGTQKGRKIWNFVGLGALLLLIAGVFFFGGLTARNPNLIPALLSGRLRLWPAQSPTPKKVVLDSHNPESYFGLLSVDPRFLPADQRKIEEALYPGLVALAEVNTPTYQAETKLGVQLFTPLGTASTKADFEAVRSVAQKLRATAQNTLDDEKRTKETLIQNLKAAGLDETLAEKIGALTVAKTRSGIDTVAGNAFRISDHTIQLVDFLQQNEADWHRDANHNLVFNSPANADRCNELFKRLKQDAEQLNKTVPQTR